MHNLDLILTLACGLGAALLLGYITHRLGLSPIVGYLLAGIVLGPSTPGYVANRGLAEQLAEVGVILLMFGVGLHFHLKELMAVRRVAVPGAIGQSLTATMLGLLVGLACGWSWSAGIVFGMAISVASTVVLLRVLVDNNDLHTPTGHIAIGWLIVEDLFTVLVLVLMPVVFQQQAAEPADVALAVAGSLVKIGLLIAFIIYIGGRVLPWLFARVAKTRSRELFTLSVLVVALGIALGAALVFGVSMALGAFLAGMVVGRSDFSTRAATEALPMRDAFAVLFFVSVGMLFDPAFLLDAPLLVAATLAIILLGKPIAALLIAWLLRYPARTSLGVAVALAQIGEFSFILADLGRRLEILPSAATSALVAASILSISLNPALYRLVDVYQKHAWRWPRIWNWLNSRVRVGLPAMANRESSPRDAGERRTAAIVVGHGPVGRTLLRLLQQNDIAAAVIEMNLDTVQRLRADGVHAIYGDATHRQTLLEAGIARAVVLILSSAGMKGSTEVIRLAREINPAVRVFARGAYLREVPILRRAGADVVFTGEGEVALAMTEFLLRQLGATPEQIDRENDRVRQELFDEPLSLELLLPVTPQAEKPSSEAQIPESETNLKHATNAAHESSHPDQLLQHAPTSQ